MIKQILLKSNMDVKNAEFDAGFEPAEKVAKYLCEKSYQRKKRDRKIKFLTYYFGQKFSANNFFWVNFFALFSTDSNSALNFVFYDIHISTLC